MSKTKDYIDKVAASFIKHAAEHKVPMVSVAIAQSAIESGWGTSYDAVNRNNILGIGPHWDFKSWDDCISAYYTKTVLGKSKELKKVESVDAYCKLILDKGYLPYSEWVGYVDSIVRIIKENKLLQYDNVEGDYESLGLTLHSGGDTDGDDGGSAGSTLYASENAPEDAVLREVAYIRNTGTAKKPKYGYSTKESRLRLSMINYTAWFEAFYQAGVAMGLVKPGSGDSSESYDLGDLDSKVATFIKYFMDKGLSAAAACGIAGNCKNESGFDTAAGGDNGTSFGLLQWHAGWGDAMKKHVGSDWASDFSGQLDYIWYTLTNPKSAYYYPELYKILKGKAAVKTSGLGTSPYIGKKVENTAEGARVAADQFVRKYERCANIDNQAKSRADNAERYFKKLIKIDKKTGKATLKEIESSGKVPANASAEQKARLNNAYSKLGTPYKWGACSANAFDCSGFVSYVLTGKYQRLGTTYTFMGWPSTKNPQPGDVWTSSTHCGIYVGNGKMVHAPQEGDVVKVSPVQSGGKYVKYNHNTASKNAKKS